MPHQPALVSALLALLCLALPQPADAAAEHAPRPLQSLLEPLRRQHDLPALAAAVVTSEGLWAVGAVGVRKQGSGIPVAIDDQFHLGSCTKAMTATLIGMLVEQGKLSWDMSIGRACPELVG
jgi:CubicO group peptidase (beta-lactamase class C family)